MMAEAAQTGVCIPDPPRVVPGHLYLRRARTMFLAGLMLVIIGLTAVIIAAALQRGLGAGLSPFADLRLNSRHQSVVATVTAKKLITSVHADSEHPWRIEFEFERPGGGSVTAAGYTYDQRLGRRLVAGDKIDIQYDPAEPTVARPVGGYVGPTAPWVGCLVGGMFVLESLIGVVLLVGAMLVSRRDGKLLAYGVGVEGEVVEVRCRKHISSGRKHPYDVHYRFRDQWGSEVAGRDRTYSYAWAKGLRPGERVGVVFNPRDPRENALWLHGKELERLGGTMPAVR